MDEVNQNDENDQGEAHDPSYLPHMIPLEEQKRLFPDARSGTCEPRFEEWYPDADGVFGIADE